MKKRLNIIMLVLTVLVGAVFGITWWQEHSKQINHAPVLRFDQETLHVSVSVTEEELLKGVTAMDPEDGDVTDSVVIESVSEFVDEDTRLVTYAAFDSMGNVQKASREMKYTDYRSPRFVQLGELRFLVGEEADLLEYIRVDDVLDGDITAKIRVIRNSYLSYEAGTYAITLQVTNSAGDTVEKEFTMICEDPDSRLTEQEQMEEQTEEELEHGE